MKQTTHVIFLLDSSGSMSGQGRRTAKSIFNAQIEAFKKAADNDNEYLITLVSFSDQYEFAYRDIPVQAVGPITDTEYWDYGRGTALLDAIGEVITQFDPPQYRDGQAFLIKVLTDGQENESRNWCGTSGYRGYSAGIVVRKNIVDLFTRVIQTQRWTIAIEMPHSYINSFVANYGISRENVFGWDESARGQAGEAEAKRVIAATSASAQSYTQTRSTGQTSVKNYYEAVTNLSGVSDVDVAKKLQDVTSGHKIYNVPKESQIDDFVSEKTKRPYVTGQAFYLLMKPEKIQDHKDVLLVKKNTKAPIYGGKEARRIIGLQDTGIGKVKPGNHGYYDIFVQSKAPNRKLPTGTRLIIDVAKVKADNPTWVPTEEDAYSLV